MKDDRERCDFMLEQLTVLDRRLQSLVNKLDSCYLSMGQAKELKHFRMCQERTTEEFRDYVVDQAKQEHRETIEAKIAAVRSEVESLKRQQSRLPVVLPTTNQHLNELEDEYGFEAKIVVGLQKHYNRSLQQDQLVRAKTRELEAREMHLLAMAERSADRIKQTLNQKTLFKKYETLLAKRAALISSNTEAEQAYRAKAKRSLDSLVQVEQHIVEENYYFADMDRQLVEQRLVIEQLKIQENLPQDSPVKNPEEKYHVQCHSQKVQNELFDKYLAERRHSSIVELPKYPTKQLPRQFSKDEAKRIQVKEIERVPIRPQMQYEFAKVQNAKNVPAAYQDRAQSTKRQRNISESQLPDLKQKISITTNNDHANTSRLREETAKGRNKGRHLRTEPVAKKKADGNDSDDSTSSNENIFRPVKIVKEVFDKPDTQVIIEDEDSDESDTGRVFTKPLQSKIVKSKNDRPAPKQITEEDEQSDTGQHELPAAARNPALMFNVREQQPKQQQAPRPKINLVLEKELRLSASSYNAVSENQEMNEMPTPPRVVHTPQEPIPRNSDFDRAVKKKTSEPVHIKPMKEPEVQVEPTIELKADDIQPQDTVKEKKLDSTSTDMGHSNALTLKKPFRPYKPRPYDQRKGIPYEAEGHSSGSRTDGDFNLSRVSSMYEPPEFSTGQHLRILPQYTAEQLGLEKPAKDPF